MNKPWEVILEEDENGEIILPLGEEFMKRHGWLPGDQIDWEVKDGYAIMTNLTAKMREEPNDFG
jgi:hypothetical protein